MVTAVVAPPCQLISASAVPRLPVDGDGDLGDHRADELLALGVGGGGRVEDGADVGAGPVQPGEFLAGERDRVAGLRAASRSASARAHGRELVFQAGPPGSGRPAGSPARPRRTGAAPGRLRTGPVPARARTRPACWRCWAARRRPWPGRWPPARPGASTANSCSPARLVQPPPPMLWQWRGAIQLGARGRTRSGGVAAVPGVADLHHPAAPAAAQQALQQRRAFAGGAAAVAARRPCSWRAAGPGCWPRRRPRRVAGMVAGDQHLPLVAGQQPLPGDHLPGRRPRASRCGCGRSANAPA